jgi:Type II/IV secretion system protein
VPPTTAAVSEASVVDAPAVKEGWDGITPPRARHVGPRFRTDVIVELGHATRERVDEAIEAVGLDRERFERAFHQAYGAVRVTGPTGSGKSTSLYAALGDVSTPEKNIITIEDPVERQIEGITHVRSIRAPG